MFPASLKRLPVYAIALVALALAALAIDGAVRWYEHPFASVLVGPDGDVSGVGSPSWEGLRKGLRFPDRIVAVDDVTLGYGPGVTPASTLNDAIVRAASAGHATVHVVVQTAQGARELDLPIRRLDATAWWLIGGVLFLAAGLYVLAATTALIASPEGPLARSFAKTAIACAAFLLTLFDLQTSGRLTIVWECALAFLPGAFVTFALRLPDDAPILKRFPRLPSLLDFVGTTLASWMVVLHLMHAPTLPVRSVLSVAFGASQVFFVVVFLVRWALARGARRMMMRALVAAVAPLHLLLAVGILLPMLSTRGSAATFFVSLPILSLTPLSAVFAFIRHDLWGSRALLSRVLTLTVAAVVATVLAIGMGAALAAGFGAPFGGALLAATAAALASAVLVSLAVRVADRGFFPSRADYKPTVEQLSEHLTSINDPDEVARSVERTVRRWLACESVVFVPRDPDDLAPPSKPTSAPRDELALPVRFRGDALGILRVGKKRGGALFTSDDLDLLRTIANQAALALAHARSYRELEVRRRQQAEAWRGERLALIETLAAEIAHEIRYPINYFRSVFQRGSEGSPLDAEEIEIGCEEVDRLERLVSGLRRVAHHRLERRWSSVAELAARAEVLLRDALGSRAIEVAIPDGAAVRCDFDQVTQIVVNLLANALDAAGATGRVGLVWRERGDEGGAELIVWDTGPGFAGDAAQLFAPWFTTKPRGTGLGLAIAQRIVRAHGWSIDARRVDGRTHFLLDIPAGDLAVEEGATAITPEPAVAEVARV